MRSTPVLVPVFLVCSVVIAASQGTNPQKPRTPKSGDTIVVKGCLRGAMLESIGMAMGDESDPLPSGHTFQLKGKKDLLKQLRAQHDGQLVEVTGVLKSALMDEGQRGARVGNTRIVVGVESTTRGGAAPPYEPLPVLEAKSFEGLSTTCRR